MSLTTRELATAAKCAEQTIRAQLCVKGSYHGIRPMKMPSGRLLWPDDSVAQLAKVGESRRHAESARLSKNSGLHQVREAQL